MTTPSRYGDGTITLTNGSTSVTGSGTAFSTQVVPGAVVVYERSLGGSPELFTLDIAGTVAVDGVTSDTSLVLDDAFSGETIAGASYFILSFNTGRDIVEAVRTLLEQMAGGGVFKNVAGIPVAADHRENEFLRNASTGVLYTKYQGQIVTISVPIGNFVGPWEGATSRFALSIAGSPAEVAIDFDDGMLDDDGVAHFSLTVDAGAEVQLPTNAEEGDVFDILFTQDGGSNEISFADGFVVTATVSTVDGARTRMRFTVTETGGSPEDATAVTGAIVSYDRNDVVSDNGKNYGSNVDNNTSEPDVGPNGDGTEFWSVIHTLEGVAGSAIVTGTSESTVTIGSSGTKVFTLAEEDERGWALGARLRAASDANPTTHWIEGIVTSYSHPALEITADASAGSGDRDDWSITVAGRQGAPGTNGSDGANGIDGASQVIRVHVADTVGLDPAEDYEAGDTVDGVTLVQNMLVLRATAGGNASDGVYVVPATGAASRHSSFDDYDDLPGTGFRVMQGTTNADTLWFCNSDQGGTLGNDAVVIEQFEGGGGIGSGTNPDAGLTSAGDAAIDTDGETTFTDGILKVHDGTRVQKFFGSRDEPAEVGLGQVFCYDGNPAEKRGRWAAVTGRRNVIIGGNFDTNPWQRGTSFVSPSNGAYAADMFAVFKAGGGDFTVSKAADAPSTQEADGVVTHCFDIEVTTADTSLTSTDLYGIRYRVEGYDWAQIANHSMNLSFWVKSSVAGIYSLAIRNNGGDRVLLSEYTIADADTWEKIILPISGSVSPAGGTWDYEDGVGITIIWGLAGGPDREGPTTGGAFLDSATDDYVTTNQTNLMGTIGNHFKLALVQLENSAVATRFEFLSKQEVLALCQRYYEKSYIDGTAPASNTTTNQLNVPCVQTNTTTVVGHVPFKVPKRAAPTITVYPPDGSPSGSMLFVGTGAGTTERSVTTAAGTNGFSITQTAALDYLAQGHFTADASL